MLSISNRRGNRMLGERKKNITTIQYFLLNSLEEFYRTGFNALAALCFLLSIAKHE